MNEYALMLLLVGAGLALLWRAMAHLQREGHKVLLSGG